MTKPKQSAGRDTAIALNLLNQMHKNLASIMKIMEAFHPEYDKTINKHELCADRRQEKAEERANARVREESAAKIFAALTAINWQPKLDENVSANERFFENERLARAIDLADRLRERLAETPDPIEVRARAARLGLEGTGVGP